MSTICGIFKKPLGSLKNKIIKVFQKLKFFYYNYIHAYYISITDSNFIIFTNQR